MLDRSVTALAVARRVSRPTEGLTVLGHRDDAEQPPVAVDHGDAARVGAQRELLAFARPAPRAGR